MASSMIFIPNLFRGRDWPPFACILHPNIPTLWWCRWRTRPRQRQQKIPRCPPIVSASSVFGCRFMVMGIVRIRMQGYGHRLIFLMPVRLLTYIYIYIYIPCWRDDGGDVTPAGEWPRANSKSRIIRYSLNIYIKFETSDLFIYLLFWHFSK